MKKNKITLDDLANMIQKSLLTTEENIKEEIKSTREELKADIKDVKADLNKKVDIFTHKDLEYRVEKLEEKVVAGRKK
ncbi:MAG: hypothetical protein COX29_03225 [Candidatus Moranbacteria bacterium CG23_combo_of_CG06-09_8_20_14_all_35_22]|nr:MAG: hypothetical protein COX29_03225 [Candidatus Moranbacteria bacterium CG23_combo_of_CG06-09_8_20_14_all_35_22]